MYNMKLFEKASASAQKMFSKGQGAVLLRKGGHTLQTLSPAIGLINPAYGVAANAVGKVLAR
jgi:hypothetical protein